MNSRTSYTPRTVAEALESLKKTHIKVKGVCELLADFKIGDKPYTGTKYYNAIHSKARNDKNVPSEFFEKLFTSVPHGAAIKQVFDDVADQHDKEFVPDDTPDVKKIESLLISSLKQGASMSAVLADLSQKMAKMETEIQELRKLK